MEADPEYQLIVESNNMIVEMDNEISEVSCAQHLSTYVFCFVFVYCCVVLSFALVVFACTNLLLVFEMIKSLKQHAPDVLLNVYM